MESIALQFCRWIATFQMMLLTFLRNSTLAANYFILDIILFIPPFVHLSRSCYPPENGVGCIVVCNSTRSYNIKTMRKVFCYCCTFKDVFNRLCVAGGAETFREGSPPPMSQVSHVMCHLSCVTCHHFIYLFFWGQSGETSRWRVCYKRGYPI